MNEQNGTEKLSGDAKVLNILHTWKHKQAVLTFHIRGGETVEGVLLFWSKYDYAVAPGAEKAAVLVAKHAVNWIERR